VEETLTGGDSVSAVARRHGVRGLLRAVRVGLRGSDRRGGGR
jgi:transposase-like protein